MTPIPVNDHLAELLRYPDAHYSQRLATCCSRLEAEAPELAQRLRQSGAALAVLTLEQMEEQFTRTFDLNPVCSLEIGWHLFGENYDRGALMARLRRELQEHGAAENGELPDHLTHVMPLLARMDSAEAEDFFAACVAPALSKMQAAFRSEHNAPFAQILTILCIWLQMRYGALVVDLPPVPVQLPILQEAAHE